MPPAARSALRVLSIAGWGLLVFLTIPDKSPSLLQAWPWPLAHQLLLAFPAIWLGVAAAAAPGQRTGLGRAAIVTLLVFGVTILTSSLFSPFRSNSLEWLPVRLGPVFLVFAVARAVAADESGDVARTVANTLAATLAGLCLLSVAWWAVADVWGAWHRAADTGRELPFTRFLGVRNERPLGHSNYTAGVAILALGWTGCLAALSNGSRRRAWVAGAVVSLVALFSSGSRGGWIGLAVLAVASVFIVMRRRGMRSSRIAVALVVVLVVSAGAALLHPRTRALFENVGKSGTLDSSDVQRYSMAQAAVLMIGDRPVIGYGPGTVPLVYPRYRERLEGGVETALQLHSTPLQLAATTGLLGLAAATALVVLVMVRLARSIRAPAFGIEGCAGLVSLGYAAFALTDYQLDVAIFGGSVAATTALALAARDSGPGRTHSGGFAAGIVSMIWLVAVIFIEWAPMTVRARFSSAIDALERLQVDQFRVLSREAIDNPHDDPRLSNITALILANPRAYGVPAAPDPPAAIALLEDSLATNPDQEIAHFNLGWLLLKSDPAAATRHFKEAARLVPDKGGVYLGIGFTLLERGATDAAVDAFAVGLINNPRLVSSPVWNAPMLKARWPAAVARAAALLDGLGAPSLNAEQVRRARYVAALFRWIAGDDAQLEIATENAGPKAMGFLASVPKMKPSSPDSPLTQPWTGPDNWRAVLSPANATTLDKMIERTAYGLMTRDSGMPVPIDLYTSIENMQVSRALPFLFPPKGWLPGPELRRLETGIPK